MSWIRLLIFGMLLGSTVGCLRDDDEPIRPTRPISRLYISTSNFQPNTALQQLENVYLVDPADDALFTSFNNAFRTGAFGGSAITYSPEVQLLFQSSQNTPSAEDHAIQIYRIDTLRGTLARQGQPTSELLTAIHNMAYHPNRDLLFMPNTRASEPTIPPSLVGSVLANAGQTQSDLFVYGRVRTKDRASLPTYRVPFSDKLIRAIFVYDISLRTEDLQNRTYISTFSEAATTEVLGYLNLPDQLANRPDSLRLDIEPDFTLSLTGVTNLLSMAYSPKLDLMVATQLVQGGNSKILFYENFSTHTTDANISVSRTIEGTRTKLANPVSVAIDTRDGARYLYVADSQAVSSTGPGAGAVLRFLITDEGDVEPNGELRIPNRTPIGVSLDARGTIPADSTINSSSIARKRR